MKLAFILGSPDHVERLGHEITLLNKGIGELFLEQRLRREKLKDTLENRIKVIADFRSECQPSEGFWAIIVHNFLKTREEALWLMQECENVTTFEIEPRPSSEDMAMQKIVEVLNKDRHFAIYSARSMKIQAHYVLHRIEYRVPYVAGAGARKHKNFA